MSANPEAFEFLSKAARVHVRKHGKDKWQLLDFCTKTILEWRQEECSELTEPEALRLAADVARWTFEKYNPPRRKAARSREERAATMVAAPVLLEFAAETFGAATVRNAARIGGQSKSTVALHLRHQGISPKRKSKIEKLPPPERRLVAILDNTLPRDGSGLVLIDDLAAALWDEQVKTSTTALPDTPRSTKSTRRKKLTAYLAAISNYGIGFHVVTTSNVVALRRGRRFRDLKEMLIWIEDERKLNGLLSIRLPDTIKQSQVRFWNDPWLMRVLAVFEMGFDPYFASEDDLEPFLKLTQPIIDMRPLYPWFTRAINSYRSCDFAENLDILSEKITDPHVRNAVVFVASKLAGLQRWARYDHPIDYFNDVDREIGFMNRLREISPDSYARCGYLRDVIFADFAKAGHQFDSLCRAAFSHCKELRAQEQSGEWVAPTAADLALYHPDNEAPF